jgi:hypothetical protein
MKQTSVEILIEKYNKQQDKYGMGSAISYSQVISDLEQVKIMEEQLIIDANYDGRIEKSALSYELAKQYYNETFKKSE